MIRRKGWKVTFQNIPRAYNSIADDMARRARDLPSPGRLELLPYQVLELTGDGLPPPIDLPSLYAALEWPSPEIRVA